MLRFRIALIAISFLALFVSVGGAQNFPSIVISNSERTLILAKQLHNGRVGSNNGPPAT
jgi:hypothetical protein